jgi:hypothetical protein
MTILVSNIMKVGAHLNDTRALVEVWNDKESDEANIVRIVDENLLALPSRSRANDVMVRALRPRFIEPAAGIIPALRVLRGNADAFRDACYYELTRVDALTASFVVEQLAAWWDSGRIAISTSDARKWVDTLAADRRIPDWSPNIRDRVARGMMAALRDFGRLTGIRASSNKEIARPGISLAGFSYVAYRLHQEALSARRILTSPVWRRWLIGDDRVDELMHQLSTIGVAHYAVMGSTLRIDWRVQSLEEAVHAAI